MGSDEEYDFSGGVSLREDGVQPGVPHTFTANESVLSLSSGQQYCYTASLHGRSAVVSVQISYTYRSLFTAFSTSQSHKAKSVGGIILAMVLVLLCYRYGRVPRE